MNLSEHNKAAINVDYRRRSGFTLFETFVSLILVSATMAIALPAFKAANYQRKAIDNRFGATTAVANLAERISAENSWKTLTPERLGKYQSQLIKQLNLSEPQVQLTLVESNKFSDVRQIRMRVSWKDTYGEEVAPVTLTLWFHRDR